MDNSNRILWGCIILGVGIFVCLLSLVSGFLLLIYGIPLSIFGIIILLNKNEDKIEKRKDFSERRSK